MRSLGSLRRWSILAGAAFAALIAFAGIAEAQQQFTGRIGPGSLYEIDVPASWNGDLVVYAHGIVDPRQPVALPEVQPLVAAWNALGFAVAFSSYSDNGYALKDGVQRTHQLRGIFVSRVGTPVHTYLVGHSLGGQVVLMLAERFPGQYDGALPMCGVLGGTRAEFQYGGNARIVFDALFPGVIPGPAFEIPEGVTITPGSTTYNAVAAALIGGMTGPSFSTLQFLNVAGVPFDLTQNIPTDPPAPEWLASGLYVLGFEVTYANNILALTHGHMPFDNASTQYPGPLNDAVARYTADPSALNYLEHNYEPTGRLQIPVLTLHTTRDPGVPIFHEALYAGKVAEAGSSDFLVQRSIDRWGHCTFTPAETFQAFGDLVTWVNTGIKPSATAAAGK